MLGFVLGLLPSAPAEEVSPITAMVAHRAAIEQVYHEQRIGAKQPFERAVPAELIEKLVRMDLNKEAVLLRHYQVEITAEMIEEEVRRIDTTTRAPETLGRIKSALRDDPRIFADSFVKPLIVERILRAKFETDDSLHAAHRRRAESARIRAIAAKQHGLDAQIATLKKTGNDSEVRERLEWQLGARPQKDPLSPPATPPEATPAEASAGIYHNKATARVSQALPPPEATDAGLNREFYFEDLPPDLQNVLAVQLRQPGDVSALIEGPRAFQVFIARSRTATSLEVALLTLPKRGFEEWLAQPPASSSP